MMKKGVTVSVFVYLLLTSLAVGQNTEPVKKKELEYKVIYTDRGNTDLNKRYSTRTLSPQVLDRVMAHEQEKRIAKQMADLPEVKDVQLIDFGNRIEYTAEAVSMKVIQSPLSPIDTTPVNLEKTVIEKVIPVREEDAVDIMTINKYSKIQKRDATERERAASKSK